MSLVKLRNGNRVVWEPTTQLICSLCRDPLDITTVHQNTLKCVNLVSIAYPDYDGLQYGDYFYLHKICSRIRESVHELWLLWEMKHILGLDPIWNKFHTDMRGAFSRRMPKGLYDKIYAQWMPQHPVKQPRIPKSGASRPGYVYFLQAEGTGRVKIGRAESTTVRFDTLRTASPFPLTLLRSVKTADAPGLETSLHRRFAAYRVHGEWFALPIEALTLLLHEDFPL